MRHSAGGQAASPQLLEEAVQSSAPAPAYDDHKRRRERSWKARATSPAAVLSAGVALLVVGAALVATPLALHSARRQGPPPPVPPPAPDSGLNAEGVPLDAAQPAQAEGELRDCAAALASREAYEAAAAAAEASLLGGRAADLPAGAVQAALGRLPPLLFGTVFWVLVSEEHPWASGFPAAAAAQVGSLNAAFDSLGMQFRLDAVVAVPAPSESVTQCTQRWQELAAGLLGDAERSGNSSGGGGGGGSTGSSDPPLVHVIVCEPEGIRGAAAVLGGGAEGGEGSGGGGGSGGMAAGTILLRRSSLWQSYSSLVHQVGHFLGLPHPFPDERQTCRLDGDGVGDTPLQYAPNTGCPAPDDEGDLHVCQGSGDGPLPILNYMDLTNDSCRVHFTPGQAARMHSLLRTHRPRLFAAASSAAPPQAPLQWVAAWQSAPPPLAVQAAQVAAVQQQASAAAAAAAAEPDEPISSAAARQVAAAAAAYAARHAAERYANPWHQAALAGDGHLSGAPQACACLGADASGRTFWTGVLNASYPVAAVRLLLPTQLDGGGGSSGERSAKAGEADSDGGPAAAVLTGVAAEVEVEVWVGDSMNHTRNQRCAPAASDSSGSGGATTPGRLLLPLRQPLHALACAAPLAGRFVTVALAAPAAAQQQVLHQPLCLCQVQALSAVVPAVPALSWSSTSSSGRAGGSSGSGGSDTSQPLPAVALNVTADMAASQSGSAGTADASLALASQQQRPQEPGLEVQQPEQQQNQQQAQQHQQQQAQQPVDEQLWEPSVPTCSSGATSAAGLPPWWSFDAGLDGAWVRGLRLALPFACQHSSRPATSGSGAAAAAECVPAGPTSLAVYVGDSPPAQLLRDVAAATGSLCAAVAALPGQPLQVDCGRYMPGRYVTVVGSAQSAALSLCDVQLLGGVELQLSHLLQQPQPGLPPDQQASLALPVDGDAGSCAAAPGGGGGNASWQLQLGGSYPLLAVRLAAVPASNATLEVELLDAGGAVAAAWQPVAASTAGSSSGAGGMLELPGATQVAALRARGFASLCEVQVLAAAAERTHGYQLLPEGGWAALGGEPSDATGAPVVTSSSGGGTPASGAALRLFDSSASTCLVAQTRPGGASGGAAVELRLGRRYRVDSVRLVAGGERPQAVDILAAAGGAPCATNVTLNPWRSLRVSCQGGLSATDRLTLQRAAPAEAAAAGLAAAGAPGPGAEAAAAAAAAGGAAGGAPDARLVLCEVALFGLPLALP